MDQRERSEDPAEMLRMAMDGRQAATWTAMPGIVQSFDGSDVSVQVSIKENVRDKTGKVTATQLPVLIHCPVVMPAGGGYAITMPVAMGDEVLVVFASRCIDNWWSKGGVQTQAEMRMHNLSDGFAIPGPFSQPRKLSGVSTTAAVLRTADSSLFVSVDKSNGQITMTAPTLVQINAPNTAVNGALLVSGVIVANGDIWAGGNQGSGVEVQHHVHTNSGGSGTGGPPLVGS